MLDLTKITPDPINPQKFVKSRDGEDVWIYWVGSQRIHGRVAGGEAEFGWSLNGRRYNTYGIYDLIMVEPETVLYANDYGDIISDWKNSRKDSDDAAASTRIGIITKRIRGDKVTVEYEDLRGRA